jgi:hypothetical protein
MSSEQRLLGLCPRCFGLQLYVVLGCMLGEFFPAVGMLRLRRDFVTAALSMTWMSSER